MTTGHGNIGYRVQTLKTIQMVNNMEKNICNKMDELQLPWLV